MIFAADLLGYTFEGFIFEDIFEFAIKKFVNKMGVIFRGVIHETLQYFVVFVLVCCTWRTFLSPYSAGLHIFRLDISLFAVNAGRAEIYHKFFNYLWATINRIPAGNVC